MSRQRQLASRCGCWSFGWARSCSCGMRGACDSRLPAKPSSPLAALFGDRGKQQLVIRVSLGFARQWLLERLAGFARKHPEIPIRLVTTVWAGEPLDSSVDVDIRLTAGPIPGMQSHQLTHDAVFPVCTPGLAKAPPRLRRPSDLRHRSLLTTIGFAEGWRHWFAAAGIDPEPSATRLELDRKSVV